VSNVHYRKGSIKALIGKDTDHLYHPKSYRRKSSIEVDYNALRDSSKQLKGAVNFALAAIKEQTTKGIKIKKDDKKKKKNNLERKNSDELGVQMEEDQKEWDITGLLLKRIGIAGMINVQISLKRWAKRSGITRPLHFSRQLGRRMRRSSSILSPLAKETLNRATQSGMSKEARAKIKLRAVRSSHASEITKRKKFLKSIALFQNFSEDILNGTLKIEKVEM
tara:strand:+ start:145 stop:810 length:666 start_codon:yes stop_codon:yes gene_type:complete